MPLTVQQNGTTVGGQSNQIQASWFNDYYDLLTGVMTDQPVFLQYNPAAGTNPPLLKLQTNGNADMVQILNSAGTVVSKIDSNGYFGGGNGNNYIKFNQSPDDIVIAPGTDNWTYFNAAMNAHVDQNGIFNGAGLAVSGNVSVGGTLGINGNNANNYGALTSPIVDIVMGYSNLRMYGDGGAHYIYTANAGTYSRDLYLGAYNGNTGNVTFGFHLNAWGICAIGMDRNGGASVNVIFTGANTPSGPNVGDIWINA